MDLSLSLGKKIRARRKELGLIAEELAKKAGIDRTYLSKIEKHGYLPSPEVLGKIVMHLNDNPESYFRVYTTLKYPGLSKTEYALLTHSNYPREDKRLANALKIKNDLIDKLKTITDPSFIAKYKQTLNDYDKLISSFYESALKNLSAVDPQTAKRYEKYK